MNFQNRLTFSLKTVGCKVNRYESQSMRESLVRSGFEEKEGECVADLLIINSCTVTHKADKDVRNLAGYTDSYVRVLVDGDDSLKNMIVPVRITHVDESKNLVFACPETIFERS
ncbi:MAG: hypothetical protein ABID09_03810 [Candidatus Omnitrophota bacterium]